MLLQVGEPSHRVLWSYHPVLVVLSVLIASLASVAAFAVVERARAAGARSLSERVAWVAYGAVAMGFGVWGMHFTGMLAVVLPVRVSYDLAVTVRSLVLGIVGSGAALHVLSAKKVGHGRFQAAALLLAGSIGAMHYTGMAALRAPLVMRYDHALVAVSLLVAYLLAAAALYTRFVLVRAGAEAKDGHVPWPYSAASAVTAGLAVAGVHYTAMAATHFYSGFAITESGVQLSASWISVAVATVTVLLVGLTLVLAYMDTRLSQASRSAKDADARHRAIVATMADGLVTFDAEGSIEAANPAAERILGTPAASMVGRPVTELLSDVSLESLPSLEATASDGLSIGKEMRVRFPDGRELIIEASITRMTIAGRPMYNAAFRDVTERRKTEMGLRRLATAVEQASESVIVSDAAGTVQYVNPAFTRTTGLLADEVLGRPMTRLADLEGSPVLAKEIEGCLEAGEVWSGRVVTHRKDGSLLEADGTVSPVRDPGGRLTNFVAVVRDVTDRGILERQLLNSQKLEAIGQLAAGIAHEINTPTQYVGDNTRFLMDAFEQLAPALRFVASMADGSAGEGTPELPESVRLVVEDAEIEFHLSEIPRAIKQSLEGISRVANIVRSMKEFSHPGEEKTLFDLNRAIESTVTVATNEWKYVAEVVMDLDPTLPLVPLLPGEFNQVILNLIVNAAHAIAEKLGENPEGRGLIVIESRPDGEYAEVRVSDTGAGIPEEIQERIFEPFFTTKDVGKGTGQGLSIAHAVVVQKHGGSLRVESRPGEGACFVIRIPLAEPGPLGAVEGEERVA